MKYINPYYPWFDSIGTVKNSGATAGYINAAGWAIKNVDEEAGTCMRMSFDVCFSGSYYGQYIAGFNYKAVDGTATPNVFLYMNNNYCFELRVKESTVLASSYKTSSGVWYHIYIEADTANGTVNVYADGVLIMAYGSYAKTGALPDNFRFYLHSSYEKMKNMIVTDGKLALDETVMEVALTEASTEWEKGDDGYSVGEKGKSLVLKPENVTAPGYVITGAGMLLESAVGCENVPALEVSMGSSKKRVELARTNSHTAGVCFENETVLGDITVVSAE